ncbi:uncharacterized protein LOC120650059 isoform X4 [Panicum virgatum]|uniref:uncharacterized protein LOC120650059 isoform X4 n=1 Tax=Panicum virgatum TaxID=38727 RepID=UPI0019D500D2|nr:uncharacterized protein LOC120650059 isoform X4 [Panicum virgatum]
MALCSDVTSPQSGMTAAPPRRLRVAARSRPPRLPRPHRIACSTARCRRLCLADRGRTPPSPPAPSRSTAPHQRLTLHCTSTSPGGCSSRPFPLIRQRRRSGASPTAAAAARTRWARSRTPCRLLNAHHVCCRNWCAVARVKIPRNTILLVSNVTVYPPAMQISWCSFGTSVVSMKRNEKTTSNTLYRKEMVAYGNGFYLAMVDVNERVSGNWSRSKVLLHLICYKAHVASPSFDVPARQLVLLVRQPTGQVQTGGHRAELHSGSLIAA